MKSNNGFHKYVPSMLLFLLFEAVRRRPITASKVFALVM